MFFFSSLSLLLLLWCVCALKSCLLLLLLLLSPLSSVTGKTAELPKEDGGKGRKKILLVATIRAKKFFYKARIYLCSSQKRVCATWQPCRSLGNALGIPSISLSPLSSLLSFLSGLRRLLCCWRCGRCSWRRRRQKVG